MQCALVNSVLGLVVIEIPNLLWLTASGIQICQAVGQIAVSWDRSGKELYIINQILHVIEDGLAQPKYYSFIALMAKLPTLIYNLFRASPKKLRSIHLQLGHFLSVVWNKIIKAILCTFG